MHVSVDFVALRPLIYRLAPKVSLTEICGHSSRTPLSLQFRLLLIDSPLLCRGSSLAAGDSQVGGSALINLTEGKCVWLILTAAVD